MGEEHTPALISELHGGDWFPTAKDLRCFRAVSREFKPQESSHEASSEPEGESDGDDWLPTAKELRSVRYALGVMSPKMWPDDWEEQLDAELDEEELEIEEQRVRNEERRRQRLHSQKMYYRRCERHLTVRPCCTGIEPAYLGRKVEILREKSRLRMARCVRQPPCPS